MAETPKGRWITVRGHPVYLTERNGQKIVTVPKHHPEAERRRNQAANARMQSAVGEEITRGAVERSKAQARYVGRYDTRAEADRAVEQKRRRGDRGRYTVEKLGTGYGVLKHP